MGPRYEIRSGSLLRAKAVSSYASDDQTTLAYAKTLRAALDRWETEGGAARDFAVPASKYQVDPDDQPGSTCTQPASASQPKFDELTVVHQAMIGSSKSLAGNALFFH
jgi:hypothetical protein